MELNHRFLDVTEAVYRYPTRGREAFADLACCYPLACAGFSCLGVRTLLCPVSLSRQVLFQTFGGLPARQHGQDHLRGSGHNGRMPPPCLASCAFARTGAGDLRIPFGAVVPWAFSDRPNASILVGPRRFARLISCTPSRRDATFPSARKFLEGPLGFAPSLSGPQPLVRTITLRPREIWSA